ncbi:MAG: MarR family winged helix-turn-helix transcriptional regulator [Beutenbergiaceae bacterium]
MTNTEYAWRSYIEATALLTAELERRMKDRANMDIGDFNVLLILNEAPQHSLRLGDLARAVAFGPTRLTYRLKRLEQRGWVKREPSPDDGRGASAVLTKKGLKTFHEATPGHSAFVRELLLDRLTPTQLTALAEIFGPLRQRLVAEATP